MPTSRERSYRIQGRSVTMPVEVRDASSGTAMFLVSAEAANKLLPGDAFEVIESVSGQTQLLLGLIDYRDNDLGDYNEIAIIFFAKPRGSAPEQAGTFIYKLPVNQSFTCEAGCTIWGFPKTLDQCEFSYTDDRLTGELVMDGQHVFTLSLPRGLPESGGPETPGEASVTYTYLDGVPHRTALTQGGATVITPGGESAPLELGTHPIADELRALGLPTQPIMTTWTEHMRGIFGVPEKL